MPVGLKLHFSCKMVKLNAHSSVKWILTPIIICIFKVCLSTYFNDMLLKKFRNQLFLPGLPTQPEKCRYCCSFSELKKKCKEFE